MSAGPAPAVRDLVYTFSWADTWADACIREMCMSGDRLLTTILRTATTDRFLVANPYRSWPIRQARRLLGQAHYPFPASEHRELVAPMRLRRRHPSSVETVRRLYAAYDRKLARAVARMGMTRPAVITVNPFVAAFSSLEWAGPVTYYALDDWTAHPRNRALWPSIEAAYVAIRTSGRRVCAVSHTLLNRLDPGGPSIVVPNGVEPEEWQPPWQLPEWYDRLSRPRLLYIGTIDERLDIDALRAVAQRFPAASVVLVGLVTNAEAIEPIRDLPNLHVFEPVGRRDVAGMTHDADVCVLPHRRTPLTETMSPIKLFEYLAGGRPVVATELPPITGVDARVVLVEPGGKFAEAVAEALASAPTTEADRSQFVDRHSWARRHQAILDFALAPDRE